MTLVTRFTGNSSIQPYRGLSVECVISVIRHAQTPAMDDTPA